MKNRQYKTKDVTFSSSKDFAFQRWYPYLEGYSPNFVLDIIKKNLCNTSLIYDPFAGTGTTMLAADTMGINSVYSEINPFLRLLIKTKFDILSLPAKDRISLSKLVRVLAGSICDDINQRAPSMELALTYKDVFGKSDYFPSETFENLLKLRTYIDDIYSEGESMVGDILSIAICSCIVDISFMKRQGDLRFMTISELKRGIPILSQKLPNKLLQISEDIADTSKVLRCSHRLITSNAKDIGNVRLSSPISAVITSPPYLNGTNYIRNTKLELWFLKELKTKNDLRELRDAVITSAICDVKKGCKLFDNRVESDMLDKLLDSLMKNPYDKRIPLMINFYFEEMYIMFQGLRKHLINGASLFVDIGDSIFGGIHIPTDMILADIVKNQGYILKNKLLLRKRKSKNGAELSQVLLQFKLKNNEQFY